MYTVYFFNLKKSALKRLPEIFLNRNCTLYSLFSYNMLVKNSSEIQLSALLSLFCMKQQGILMKCGQFFRLSEERNYARLLELSLKGSAPKQLKLNVYKHLSTFIDRSVTFSLKLN